MILLPLLLFAHIEGNHAVSDAQIEANAVSDDPADLVSAAYWLYWDLGYVDVNVDYIDGDQPTLRIEEGHPYRLGKVELRGFPDDARRYLTLKSGAIFDRSAVVAQKMRLLPLHAFGKLELHIDLGKGRTIDVVYAWTPS